MRKITSLIIGVAIATVGFSQITFQKILNDGSGNLSNRQIESTNDGGYISVGRTYAYGQGNADVVVTKWNEKGEVQWVKTIGGTAIDDGFDVKQDLNGNYVIGGITRSFGQVGGDEMYVIKLDSIGGILWTKTFGNPSSSERIKGVEVTSDNKYLFTGSAPNSKNGLSVLKTDENGNVEWLKNYYLPNFGFGEGWGIFECSNGDYCAYGLNISSIANQTTFVLRINSNGGVIWSKNYATGSNIGFLGACEDDDGSIYVTTHSPSSSVEAHISITKLSSAGSEIWRKEFYTGDTEIIFDLIFRNDLIYGAGFSRIAGVTTGLFISVDKNGNLINSKLIGSSSDDMILSIGSGINNIIGIGNTENFSSTNFTYLVNLDSILNSECNQSNISLSDSLIANTGQSFTINVLDTTVLVGSGGILLDITSNFQDSTLCYQYLGCMDTSAENYNPDATVDDGSCIIDGVGRSSEFGNDIQIYPNPADKELKINLSNFNYKVYDVKMYDQKGVELYSRSTSDNSNKPLLLNLDVTEFDSGMYVVLISTEKGSVKRNIVLK